MNAVHNGSNAIFVIMDNKGTAMTGFQPHPGSAINAVGQAVHAIDIENVAGASARRSKRPIPST